MFTVLTILLGVAIILFVFYFIELYKKGTDIEGNIQFKEAGLKPMYGMLSRNYLKVKKLIAQNKLPHDLRDHIEIYRQIWQFNEDEALLASYLHVSLVADIAYAINEYKAKDFFLKPELVKNPFHCRISGWKIFAQLEHQRLENKSFSEKEFSLWFNSLVNCLYIIFHKEDHRSSLRITLEELGIPSKDLSPEWELFIQTLKV